MPPTTGKVPGNGTGTLSFTIPGDGLDVESVYAIIDATGAGGPVTAEITIQDQSGVVIARKVQSSTVAAGATGSATWALRLDDDSSSSTAAGAIRFDFFNNGGALDLRTRDSGYSTFGFNLNDTSSSGIRIRQNANGPTLIETSGDGGIEIRSDGNGELLVRQTGGGALRIQDDGDGGTQINDFGLGGIWIHATGADVVFQKQSADNFVFIDLPTIAPATSGAIWNNGGVVNVVP